MNPAFSTVAMVLVSALMAPAQIAIRGPYLQQAGPERMTVRWRGGETAGRVRFGTNPAALDRGADEAAAPASPFDHAVVLTGLAPATTYFYNIGDAGGVSAASADFHFTTPPQAGAAARVRVWVLGDAGTADVFQEQTRDGFRAWAGSQPPDLVLQLGDNAYWAGEDGEFQAALFQMYQPELCHLPFWSCLGNHDIDNTPADGREFPYFQIYSFPTAGECGGTASGTERFFSFDSGNVHFVSLDSTLSDRSATGSMAAWLQRDLAATTATWLIAFFHHAPYTKGSHDSDTEIGLVEMRANLLPILEAGGVDLVLSGHSHCYERSVLLDGHYGPSNTLAAAMIKNGGDGRATGTGSYRKPLTGPRGRRGTVYCVAGSAGMTSGGTLNHPVHRVALNTLGSLGIDISGTRLDATFVTNTGVAADTFTILKEDAPDSDLDKIPDGYETLHGLDPQNPATALRDADGDGTDNLSEYVFGRPASVADRYVVEVTRQSGPAATKVTFPSVPERVYQVWWSETLQAGDWYAGSPQMAGTGGTLAWVDDGPAGARRFYRVQAMVMP